MAGTSDSEVAENNEGSKMTGPQTAEDIIEKAVETAKAPQKVPLRSIPVALISTMRGKPNSLSSLANKSGKVKEKTGWTEVGKTRTRSARIRKEVGRKSQVEDERNGSRSDQMDFVLETSDECNDPTPLPRVPRKKITKAGPSTEHDESGETEPNTGKDGKGQKEVETISDDNAGDQPDVLTQANRVVEGGAADGENEISINESKSMSDSVRGGTGILQCTSVVGDGNDEVLNVEQGVDCEKDVITTSAPRNVGGTEMSTTDRGMVLTATQLISIFETCTVRVPENGQHAKFREHVHISSVKDRTPPSDARCLYPLSKIRAVTADNRASLRKAFSKEAGDGYIWLRTMGSIVVALTASEAGIEVGNEDIEKHSVWGAEGIGNPQYVYSIKKGREPEIPRTWFDEEKNPRLPEDLTYGVVDGAVRATFISEEAPYLQPDIVVWIIPEQMFEGMEVDAEDSSGGRMRCLTHLFTPVAQRINRSAHTGASNSFAQMIETVARRRTAAVESMAYRLYVTNVHADPVTVSHLCERNDGEAPPPVDDSWHWMWKFHNTSQRLAWGSPARPEVEEDIMLEGNNVPRDALGFAARKSVPNVAISKSEIDRLFVSGRVLWNGEENTAMHVYQGCTSDPLLIARDLAVTTWLEILHQHDVLDFDGLLLARFDMSSSWTTYRDILKSVAPLVKVVLGFDGDVRLGSKGTKESMRTTIHRVVVQGEQSLLKYELLNLVGTAFIRRMDIHAESILSDSVVSPLRVLEMVVGNDDAGGVERNRRDKYGHRSTTPPTKYATLQDLCLSRSMRVADGVFRVCTQILGLSNANVVLRASKRCPMSKENVAWKSAASFFGKFNWHRPPTYEDVMGWCGALNKGSKRSVTAYRGNIVANDGPTREWGMYNLDPILCRVVMNALDDIRLLLLGILTKRNCDRDMWSSTVFAGKEKMRDTPFGFLGEDGDHKLFKIIFDHCETEQEGLWNAKQMPQRLERVHNAVREDRQAGRGGHAFSVPIVDRVENSVLNSIKIRYMSTFLKPRDDNIAGFEGVLDELPAVTASDCGGGRNRKDGEGGLVVEVATRKRTSFRMRKSITVWKYHTAVLSEVEKFGREDQTRKKAYLMSVVFLMKKMGVTMDSLPEDMASLEEFVESHMDQTIPLEVEKKRPKTDDALLEEFRDMMGEEPTSAVVLGGDVRVVEGEEVADCDGSGDLQPSEEIIVGNKTTSGSKHGGRKRRDCAVSNSPEGSVTGAKRNRVGNVKRSKKRRTS